MPAKEHQLTVRGVDSQLKSRLEREARKRGWSLNHTVLFLLKRGTGMNEEVSRYSDLDAVLGQWTAEEGEEFDRALSKQRQIDLELWK